MDAHHSSTPIFPKLIVLKRLLDFGAAFHHERTVTKDGFRNRLAGRVAGDQAPVGRQVIREQRRQPVDVVAPVPMEFTRHPKPCHELDTNEE